MSHVGEGEMSHLDEGLIHAYLDGEAVGGPREGAEGAEGAEGTELHRHEIERHLAVCAECRARLEEARRLRDRAAQILEGSGPAGITTPPFEQVLERSRRAGTSGRVLKLNRLRRLAWAATVVLALGVGWYARGSLGPEPSSAPAVSTALEESDRPADVERLDLLREGVAKTGRQEAARPQAAPTERTAATRGLGTEESAVAGPPMRAAAQAPAAAPAPTSEIEAAVVKPARELPERRAEPVTQDRLRQGAVAAKVAAEQQPAEVARRELAGAGAARARDEAQMWRRVDRDQAEHHLGGRLLAVDELPVTAISIGEVAQEPAVRMVQEVGQDQQLELVQVRSSNAEATARALRAYWEALTPRHDDAVLAWATTSVVRDGYLIIARAPVSADSLRALLQKIR